jgi:hypothetical protein
MTNMTSSVPEMHADELKAHAEIGSVKSKNNTMKGIMIITVVTTINLIGIGHRK